MLQARARQLQSFGIRSGARVAHALAKDSKKSFWAIADQGIVSLGNFAINILLARHFAQLGRLAEYGVFGLIFEMMLFLNGIHAALIVYPLTIRGAAAVDRAGLRNLMSICVTITLAALPLVGGIVGVTAAILSRNVQVGIWAGIALMAWQAQETTRKTHMAQLHFRSAILGDAISYLGQLACVYWLARTGHLSLVTTYQSIAATSAVGLILQAWQVGWGRVDTASAVAFAKEAWVLGRWVLSSNLSILFTGTLFTANFMFWAGKELVGVAAGINNLVRLTNPILIVVASLITPRAARARAHGVRAAAKLSVRLAMLGAAILLPYLAMLIIMPTFVVRVAYGENLVYIASAHVLVIIACQNLAAYCAAAAAAFLNAIQKSWDAFKGQLAYAVTMVVLGMPLTALLHFPGTAIGALVASMLQFSMLVLVVRRVIRVEGQHAHASPLVSVAH